MSTAQTHRFHVHPCANRAEGHLVPGAENAEDAAMSFLEHWAPAEDGEVSVIVRDCETGQQACFRLDVSSGELAPCG